MATRRKMHPAAKHRRVQRVAAKTVSPLLWDSAESKQHSALASSHMFLKTRNPVYALQSFVAAVTACEVAPAARLSRMRTDRGASAVTISLDRETCEFLTRGFKRYLQDEDESNVSLERTLGLRTARIPGKAFKDVLCTANDFILMLEIAKLRALGVRMDDVLTLVCRLIEEVRTPISTRWKLREVKQASALHKKWKHWPERRHWEQYMKEDVSKWTPDRKRKYLGGYPTDTHDSLPDHLKILLRSQPSKAS